MQRLILVVLIAVLAVCPAGGQGADEFDEARVLADVRALASLGPRVAATAGERAAMAWIIQQFEAMGFSPRIDQFPFAPDPFYTGIYRGTYDNVSANILATIPGADPVAGTIYVGAHYDSVPHSSGANDNASGIATLLELMRKIKDGPPLRATVVGIAFGAEEFGLLGSHAYVSTLDRRSHTVANAMYNLDCVGLGSATNIDTSSASSSQALALQTAAAAASLGFPTKLRVNPRSDHVAFAAVGIPAVLVSAEDVSSGDCGPCYHQPCDEATSVEPPTLDRIGRITLAAIRDISMVAPEHALMQTFLPIIVVSTP